MHSARIFAVLALCLAPATVALSSGCGGKEVKYPAGGGDAGPNANGQKVTDGHGAELGVVDPNGSGLTGEALASYQKGWKAWLDADLAGAKQYFTEAISKDSRAAAPHYSLGVVLERLGDTSGAQQEYRSAFTAHSDHEISMGAYALSLANNGHTGEADTFLTDQKVKKPNSARLTTYLAEVKSLANDHGTAQQLAQDALRMNPDYKEAMVTIARDHYRARKLDLAKYALQAILDGFGDSAPPRDKDNAEAHLVRGLILREGGQRAFAMKDFEAARAKRPDMVEALLQLGTMRLEAGNGPDALPLLETAVKYAPKSPLAHLALGDCYRLLGRVPDAKKEMEQALALDATLAVVHYDLGLLYLNAQSVPGLNADNQVSTAIKEFEQYKTMRGPKPPVGVSDDIDDLLNRAKAKQAELKNASAAAAAASAAPPPAPAAPASGAASAAPAAATDAGAKK